jgi:hypothetical protein
VAVKVSRVVLALAVRMICGLGENDGAMLPCAFAMGKRIFDTYLCDVRALGNDVALGDRETSFTGAHLDAVVGDP